jgi:hypothetical protein
MITRFLLILGGLFAVGLVGAFLLYVSVLTIVTAMAILLGLIAALVLGFWAGSSSLELNQHPPRARNPRDVSAISAHQDRASLPKIPVPTGLRSM